MELPNVMLVLGVCVMLLWQKSYGMPPYSNTGKVVQKFYTDCTSTGLTGDDNLVYYMCSYLVYSIQKNADSGSIYGTSVNDYNGTALLFPNTAKLTSISSSGKGLFLYDSAFNNIMECPTNPLIACNSGIQSNASNVGGIFVDQYNYIWANGAFHNATSCGYCYFINSIVVFGVQNNAITSFNLTQIYTNVMPKTGAILITPDDKLYIAYGINVTSYAIKRNGSYHPVALQFISSYTQLTSSSNYYIGLSYNKLGQVVALSNNGCVLVIDQYGGPSYFQLPDFITSTTGIWADAQSGYVFVTSGQWLYFMELFNL